MTGLIPPTRTDVLSLDGTVEHSVAELECFAGDEVTVETIRIGGYGHWQEKSTLRELWTKKEYGQWDAFNRLLARWRRETIPVLKSELHARIINKYGTLDRAKFERKLNLSMKKDPRLDVLTRNGRIVRTTIADQHKFAAKIAARSASGKSLIYR